MFCFWRVLICFAIFSALLGFGVKTFGEEVLTIDEAVSQALQENAQLQAKEANVEAYKARVFVAKSLEDPKVGVEFYQVPMNTADVTQGMDVDYSFIQTIPFPGKLSSKKKAAENEYFSQKSSLDGRRIVLVAQTEHAFHELYWVEHSIAVNRELQSLWRKFSASEGSRYTTGDQTSRDFLKAKVELDKLQGEAALLEAKRIQAQAMLNILRHRDPSLPVRLAELPQHNHPFPSYAELERKVLENHPELKAAQYHVAAQRANVSLTKREALLPDLELKATYVQRFGQIDAWGAEAMINIPFLWGKNRRRTQEAEALKKMSEQERLSVQDEKLAAVKESYANWESSKKVWELYRAQILPHATIAMKAAEAAYETGKDDFLNLVDTARQFREAKLGWLEAWVNYHKAITHLKMAVGEDFMAALMKPSKERL